MRLSLRLLCRECSEVNRLQVKGCVSSMTDRVKTGRYVVDEGIRSERPEQAAAPEIDRSTNDGLLRTSLCPSWESCSLKSFRFRAAELHP